MNQNQSIEVTIELRSVSVAAPADGRVISGGVCKRLPSHASDVPLPRYLHVASRTSACLVSAALLGNNHQQLVTQTPIHANIYSPYRTFALLAVSGTRRTRTHYYNLK